MRAGWNNNYEQVYKLQVFLNEMLDTEINTDGVFTPETEAAVREFQELYSENILDPWDLDKGTGFVYLTTKRWINILKCPDIDEPMPELVPYSD